MCHSLQKNNGIVASVDVESPNTSTMGQSSLPRYSLQHFSPKSYHPEFSQSAGFDGGAFIPTPLFVQVIGAALETCHFPHARLVAVVVVVAAVVVVIVVPSTSTLLQSSLFMYPLQHASPDLYHPNPSHNDESDIDSSSFIPIPLFVHVIGASLEICHFPQSPELCVTITPPLEVVVVVATVVVVVDTGSSVGSLVGNCVGNGVGSFVGSLVGICEGNGVGCFVGSWVGICEGSGVGCFVGASDEQEGNIHTSLLIHIQLPPLQSQLRASYV